MLNFHISSSIFTSFRGVIPPQKNDPQSIVFNLFKWTVLQNKNIEFNRREGKLYAITIPPPTADIKYLTYPVQQASQENPVIPLDTKMIDRSIEKLKPKQESGLTHVVSNIINTVESPAKEQPQPSISRSGNSRIAKAKKLKSLVNEKICAMRLEIESRKMLNSPFTTYAEIEEWENISKQFTEDASLFSNKFELLKEIFHCKVKKDLKKQLYNLENQELPKIFQKKSFKILNCDTNCSEIAFFDDEFEHISNQFRFLDGKDPDIENQYNQLMKIFNDYKENFNQWLGTLNLKNIHPFLKQQKIILLKLLSQSEELTEENLEIIQQKIEKSIRVFNNLLYASSFTNQCDEISKECHTHLKALNEIWEKCFHKKQAKKFYHSFYARKEESNSLILN